MKTQLSVNINKIATLRNARGKNLPDLCYFAKIVLQTKAKGLTIHPRPDERHIRYQDVKDIKKLIKNYLDKELNIEGYPSLPFMELVKKIKPHQCTLVPDSPQVITSHEGWDFIKKEEFLIEKIKEMKEKSIRVSLFLDPLKFNLKQNESLQKINPDRVEFYTEAYANSYKNKKKRKKILALYQKWGKLIQKSSIDLNAGHDLNQENLLELLKALPYIKEISIGQALISESLEKGLSSTIHSYLKIIKSALS
ncbi:MAG: pyridoxine 5'-phosphate synthase [Bdellovibrionales bacterium]|nr:pyridoxine 5'-phosphate synthase [Bdellovibrionales bacterium]